MAVLPNQMNGIVKSVLSGDTLMIMGADASRGPPPEKMLTLSGIIAPRLANRNAQSADQPFAWGSREFLRQMTIGKRVLFTIEPISNPNPQQPTQGTPREYGQVVLADTGESLSKLIVQHGWARIKEVRGPSEARALEMEELRELSSGAEQQGLGIFGQERGVAVRDVKWAGSFDTAELLKEMKGTPQDAIVEQVSSGSALRCLLLPGMQQVTIILTGVSCPGIRRGEDGVEEAAPFSREARFFVESRLLNRDVQVKLEGLDKNGLLFGSVLHPAGNIAVELVRTGLAKVVDWSSSLCDHSPQLRAAERDAKAKRLRIWRDYVPPNHGGDMGEFAAKVVEIVSGDTIIVLDPNNVERRMSLSSIRCPRMTKEPEPYAAEAKEMLRKLLIGKKVKIAPEFRRTFAPQEGGPPSQVEQTRTFCSCFYNQDKNAALTLVSEGLASVQRHGSSDERSVHYEALLEAETAATAAKKGLHSNKTPMTRASVTDLTGPAAKERAKSYLGSLTRNGRMRAVVQFVVNGARLKLSLPKENCIITFVCVGLRCPQCARRDGDGAAEPFGNEALAFTRQLCFQRDVEVEIENIDKSGAFLGSLFLSDKRSLGVALLGAGLASRIPPAADRSLHGDELFRAEESAKKSGLKLWENFSEEEEARAKSELAAAQQAEAEPLPDAQKQMVELALTEIVDGAHFYAHVASDSTVTMLQQRLAASCIGGSQPYEPKVGSLCCARFSQDDEWYRAKVVERRKTEFVVVFVDYGNKDLLKADRLRPLDPTLGVVAISPQAIECRLACLLVNDANDDADGRDAAMTLGESAWGKSTLARVEDKQGDVLHVTLFESNANINERLVSSGLARVHKTVPRRMGLLGAVLLEKQAQAKAARQGMWRYGDIEEDDDFEFGTRKRDAQQAADAAKGGAGRR